MAYVAVSESPIHVRQTGGPVDPGYGVSGEHPSQGPVVPPGPVDPGYGFPLPPVVSHPIAPPPDYPTQGPVPPTYPVDPGYGLPMPPTVWPQPPRPVDPDYSVPVPISPSHPIYMPAPGAPDNSLPLPPGAVWPPLPPALDDGEFLVIAWIPGIGWRWTVIDTGLAPTQPIAQPVYPSHQPVPPSGEHPSQGLPRPPGQGRPPRPDNTLPGSGERPDNTLPPTAQPKT